MYLVIIAWIYVVLMMSVAEATATQGTVLGAIVTFFLYGVGPAALVAYLMGTPARNRANKKRAAEEFAAAQAVAPTSHSGTAPLTPDQSASDQPNASSHPASGVETVAAAGNSAGITPVRKVL